jgi:hypothetical protein
VSAQTAHLFLLDDLEDAGETKKLAKSELDALRAVAAWITSFIARPHKEIGRVGTVCPFVPHALERKTVWLAPEHSAGQSVADVVQLMNGYKRLLLDAQPVDGEDAIYKAIVVVFTDLAADRAQDFLDSVLKQLAIAWYAQDGVVLGPFFERNELTAIHNKNFRPFTPPVPFLLVRPAVVSDWKFFIDNDEWLDVWARRFGVSAVHALAERLRGLPWRETGAVSD